MSLIKSWAPIWALAFPIIISNVTIPLLGAVDAAVMGHMESAAYLGAVALGGLIFDYIYWGFSFLRLSTTGLAAQALGGNDQREAQNVFMRAVLIALIGACLIWLLQGVIFTLAIGFFDASDQVKDLCAQYFYIRIWAAPAALMNYVLIGWILAAKDTRGVLYQQVITNLVNVILDIWFVIGLDMGVDGVALATVIAQYVGLVVGLSVLRRHIGSFHFKGSMKQIWDWQKLTRLMKMNGDLVVRTVCLLTAFAWFNAQGAKQGDVILAANAILLQFQQFTSYALDGFAHALEVLGARAMGAKDRDGFKAAIRKSTELAAVFAVLFGCVYLIFGDGLIGLFSDLDNVLAQAREYAIWIAFLPIVAVWSFQLDGLYFGMTQTAILRNMMLVSLGIYLIIGPFMQTLWGNHGLWAAFTIFMGLRAVTLGMTLPSVEKKVFA